MDEKREKERYVTPFSLVETLQTLVPKVLLPSSGMSSKPAVGWLRSYATKWKVASSIPSQVNSFLNPLNPS
jgi:hypothetical protein